MWLYIHSNWLWRTKHSANKREMVYQCRCATFWLENAPFLHGNLHEYCNIVDLPVKEAERASVTIRKHIGCLLSSKANTIGLETLYIYPSGMSVISHTAAALNSLQSDSQRHCRAITFGRVFLEQESRPQHLGSPG